MASIAAALDRIKNDPLEALNWDAVEEVCRELGYVNWRERELDPATTTALFVQHVIHGNAPCTEAESVAARSPVSAGEKVTFTTKVPPGGIVAGSPLAGERKNSPMLLPVSLSAV